MNILSICGGGCRGIMCLYTLRELEKKTGKRIANIFDYFGASSIGSVITCALLISDDGINPKYTCEELYEIIGKLFKKIFSDSIYYKIKTGYGWFGSKYPNDNLEKSLEDFFENKKISDLLKPVCFPSFDGISQKPIYFTKETHGDIFIKDMLRATCAAPSYFDPKNMNINGIDYTLYDSGVVCNNTALNIELYATHDLKIIDKSNIFELCLGTGTTYTPLPTNGGTTGWLNSIIGYLFSGYNNNEIHELNLILDKDHFLFIDVEIDKYEDLDNASDEAINYYISKINKWLSENEIMFSDFVNKLITNN